jgi:cyclopropane fatty-acyl-phospholipid synthase-like methyltransferase
MMAVSVDLWTHAQAYVGNANEAYHMAGICQLELLKRNGLKPHHHVLEVGCGALVAGRPLIQYLGPDRYVGIEPNTWLVDAARGHFPDMPEWFVDKKPIFLARTDFDASETNRRFDFVLSHSVLSHAAHWQLPLFLGKLAGVLGPFGMIVASLRLYDEHGNRMGNSLHETWQYPDASYFAIETIQHEAENVGLKAEHVPEYREFFSRYVTSNIHDWIRVKRPWRFGARVPRPTEALYGNPDPSGLEREADKH